MRQIHMVTGLPRSGSTLLCNLLNQNPNVYASPTSGLPAMLRLLRDQWDAVPPHRSHDRHNKIASMQGLARNYHDTDRDIIFDKSRDWPSLLELATEIVPECVLIATVRSVPEVLASMELRWRETNKYSVPPDQRQNPANFATIQTRCNYWMRPGGVVNAPLVQLSEAFRRGHEKRIVIVEFDNLCTNPLIELRKIHQVTGMPWFPHYDPNKIEDTVAENDMAHGYIDLHKMRDSKIFKVEHRARQVLGEEMFHKYSNLDFWRQNSQNSSQNQEPNSSNNGNIEQRNLEIPHEESESENDENEESELYKPYF